MLRRFLTPDSLVSSPLLGQNYIAKLVYGLFLATRTVPVLTATETTVAATGPAAVSAVQSKADALTRAWETARGGVPLARAIEQGLVNPSGKLGQVLGGIEQGFAASRPKFTIDALGIVQRATGQVGLEPGFATLGKSGEIVLQNVGGITTTLGPEGSILVQRGSDILLHLLP